MEAADLLYRQHVTAVLASNANKVLFSNHNHADLALWWFDAKEPVTKFGKGGTIPTGTVILHPNIPHEKIKITKKWVSENYGKDILPREIPECREYLMRVLEVVRQWSFWHVQELILAEALALRILSDPKLQSSVCKTMKEVALSWKNDHGEENAKKFFQMLYGYFDRMPIEMVKLEKRILKDQGYRYKQQPCLKQTFVQACLKDVS